MSEGLRFHPQVPFDLAEAITHYESISTDLANRFRVPGSNVLKRIREFPEMHAVVFDDVRIVRVERFPYVVQYRIKNNIPYILAVFHSSTDPKKWQQRASAEWRQKLIVIGFRPINHPSLRIIAPIRKSVDAMKPICSDPCRTSSKFSDA